MKKNQDNVAISNVSTDLIKKRRRRRIGGIVLGVVAIGIGAGAFYALTDSGSALNHTKKVIECAETAEIHHHEDTCYTTDEYGDEILTCGYADYVVHTHNDYCYDEDGVLICGLPEVEVHEHDDSCWVEEKILICGLEETEIVEPAEDIYLDTETIEPTADGEYDEIVDHVYYVDDSAPADETSEGFDASSDEGQIEDTTTIEDTEAPLAAPAHVHDDSCYEIRRVLGCGKLELHTHDEACFDEDGKLICGLTELKEHNHTEACVTKRELTEEEIAALNRADPDEMTQPEIHTKTYECDEYIVTVTYSDLAEIPNDAELVVKEVTSDDAQYEKLQSEVEQLTAGDDAKSEPSASDDEEDADNAQPAGGLAIFKTLDISFMLNGQEIEPAEEVRVDVKFIENDFGADDEMTVIHHNNNGGQIIDKQTVDESGDMSFTTDSFSFYTFATTPKVEKNIKEGTYSNYFKFSYNSMENAFIDDPKYDIYRVKNGAMGEVASSFHIVAFDTANTNSKHTNGNILAKNFYNDNDNWGTHAQNGQSITELSYIQNVKNKIAIRAEEDGSKDNPHALVVGSDVNVFSMNQGTEFYIGDKWERMTVNQSAEYVVKDVSTGTAPFINLNQVYNEVTSISKDLASQSDINAYVDYKRQGDGKINGINKIVLTNPDVAGYVNFKMSDLQNMDPNGELLITGFETTDGSNDVKKAKKGSIIINIDFEQRDWGNISLFGNGSGWKVRFNDGKWGQFEASHDEVINFEGGKVILNLYNAKRGTNIEFAQVCGIILAPDCNIKVRNGNGNFIAQNVTIDGETHRSDFTGTTVPFAAGLKAKKTVNGSAPAENQTFEFGLYEKQWDGSWKQIQKKTNNLSNIAFDNIVYGTTADKGIHIYMVREIPGKAGYTYDNTAYFIRTNVTESNGKYNATSEYFKADYTEGMAPVFNTPVGEEDIAFNNLDSTSIEVQKEWFAADGVTPLYEDLPDQIVVAIYQAVGSNEGSRMSRQDASVVLNKGNNWHYKWDNLPRQNENGEPYSYYVHEEKVEGYELVSPDIRKTEGTITLTNRKNPRKTSVKVDKKFFVGDDEVYLTGNDAKNGYVKFKLLWSCDGGQTWQPHVYATSVRPVNDSAIYTLDASNNWSLEIGDLPAEGFETWTYRTYQYKVVEELCNIPGFSFGMPGEESNTKTEVEDKGGNVFVIKNTTGNTVDLEIDKKWVTVDGGEDGIQRGANSSAFITLKLSMGDDIIGYYQMRHGSFIQVDSERDGNEITPTYEITVDKDKKWWAKISGLPKYVAENGRIVLARYSVSEVVVDEVDGHKVVYDGYENQELFQTSSDIDHLSFSLKNKCFVTYDLPATGGRGTFSGAVSKWLKGHLN